MQTGLDTFLMSYGALITPTYQLKCEQPKQGKKSPRFI